LKIGEFFETVEDSLLAQFREAGFVQHSGDKGENREEILRQFLEERLPRRYGVVKGEILHPDGMHSHAADLIIYDALNCPVLFTGKTAVLPVEGVYGIIEVKSRLSKQEFLDASKKIEALKRLAPRELSIIETREYMTVHRPTRPFGIVLGYQLDRNSLESLKANWLEENERIHDVNYFVNLTAVLGEGLLHYEQVNLTRGTKETLIDTDAFVNLVLTHQKHAANEEKADEVLTRIVIEALRLRTFGRFFVYLQILLSRMKLGVPDLGRYLDPELPRLIVRES
jgi:hypothetical protein